MFGVIRVIPTRSPRLTTVLQGLGQDWISDYLNPLANVVQQYYDTQAQQYGVQAQQVVKSTPMPNISPIYLIGGGMLLWLLFRGGVKGKERRKRRYR